MIDATGMSGLTSSSTQASRTQLDRDQFLTLLVTQLRNQDPLSPLQPHEFAAQLAQFTSVEQLTNLNEAMAMQTQTIQLGHLLSEATFSASLIGRQVVVDGNQVEIPADGAGKVRFEPSAAGAAELRLLDDKGNEVAKRSLGPVGKGRQTITLPDDLPPGTYHYEIKVTGADDKAVPVKTFTLGSVDAVYFRAGGIILRMGDIEVSMDGLSEIEPVTDTRTSG
jgi:flagellar basal-body rod modification protein FlgD